MLVSIFILKYAEEPVNAVQAAKGQHGQPAQGLSVKGTVNSGPLYPGRPRYDKSGLREEGNGSQAGTWLQINWDKYCKDTHKYRFMLCAQTVMDVQTSKHAHNLKKKGVCKAYLSLLQPSR